MFATLPLEAFVCREVAETYFWPDEKEFNKKRHVLITSALVFSALIGKRPRSLSLFSEICKLIRFLVFVLVSLITCDLGLILELAGGFSATALAYLFRSPPFLPLSSSFPLILPLANTAAACFLKLAGHGSQQAPQRLAAWVCAVFGVLVMVLSTYLSIRKALKGGSHKVCVG